MTLAELEAAFARFSWWEGWSFHVRESKYEGPFLTIRATVPNAYRPGETVDLGIDTPIPPLDDEADLWRWLLWRLCRVATHEAREWARVDGVCISDPHGEEP